MIIVMDTMTIFLIKKLLTKFLNKNGKGRKGVYSCHVDPV